MNSREKEVTIITHSAITVLNAIYQPLGSAVGVVGPTKVTVTSSKTSTIDISPKEAGMTLVKTCLDTFEARFHHSTSELEIVTNSSLPPERGLKTSSAVASALMIALAKFFNMKMTLLEALVLGAHASMNAGVSVTGALDDAIACTVGGWNLVRNREFKLSFLKPTPLMELACLLLIPEKRRPKLFFGLARERESNQEFQKMLSKARRAAEKGDIITAIRLNTLSYTKELNVPEADFIDILNSHKKVMVAGLNGGGPSMFVFCKKKDQNELLNDLTANFPEYNVKQARFRSIQGDLNAYIY